MNRSCSPCNNSSASLKASLLISPRPSPANLATCLLRLYRQAKTRRRTVRAQDPLTKRHLLLKARKSGMGTRQIPRSHRPKLFTSRRVKTRTMVRTDSKSLAVGQRTRQLVVWLHRVSPTTSVITKQRYTVELYIYLHSALH